MKCFKSILLSFMLCLVASPGYAQATDEVTLTVSSDGPTKEEATKNALRSAIEQAYGTFVSANTTILNDELVKDEIVTIANGNIKSYEEISATAMPDGSQFVTLKATVSVSKLISYAQSKGAETEFAGASFGMSMKMKEMNKENEMKVLRNLNIQVEKMLPSAFDVELIISDPAVTDKFDFLSYIKNERVTENLDKIKDFAKSKATYSKDSKRDPNDKETETGRAYISSEIENSIVNWLMSADDSYKIKMTVKFNRNENTDKLFVLIFNTIYSLALTPEEKEEYKNLNLGTTDTYISADNLYNSDYEYGDDWIDATIDGSLRNTQKDIYMWLKDLANIFAEFFSNIKIIDNTGTESYFTEILYQDYNNVHYNNNFYYDPNGLIDVNMYRCFMLKGYGLFSPFTLSSYNLYVLRGQSSSDKYSDRLDLLISDPTIECVFLMPKADIYKYSNFKVELR